jgi:ferric-dicitrate binding protein FerR (iron transport regulator)
VTVPRFARLASQLMRNASELRATPAPSAEVRARAISELERALLTSRRRKRALRGSLGALAAAAAVAVVWVSQTRAPLGAAPSARTRVGSAALSVAETADVVARSFGGGALIEGGTPLQGATGQALAAGARVVALPHGHAVLAFASGTRVDLNEGGEITLVQTGATHLLALDKGALHADVAKLGSGQRFVVRTADAEVEVHGTSFRVATMTAGERCGDGARTRVNVYEGVVTVRHGKLESYVRPGESWPADCGPVQAPTVVQNGRQLAPAPSQGLRPLATRRQSGAQQIAPASELSAQNDAFARALQAKRAGKPLAAVAVFERLLAEYPQGPLAESAAVERMWLLRELDPARATAAAQAYLTGYPSGFARAEAAAIATEKR